MHRRFNPFQSRRLVLPVALALALGGGSAFTAAADSSSRDKQFRKHEDVRRNGQSKVSAQKRDHRDRRGGERPQARRGDGDRRGAAATRDRHRQPPRQARGTNNHRGDRRGAPRARSGQNHRRDHGYRSDSRRRDQGRHYRDRGHRDRTRHRTPPRYRDQRRHYKKPHHRRHVERRPAYRHHRPKYRSDYRHHTRHRPNYRQTRRPWWDCDIRSGFYVRFGSYYDRHFNVPHRLSYDRYDDYDQYYYDRVYHDGVWLDVYLFPVYHRDRVEYRPYAYCEGKLYGHASFDTRGGLRFDIGFRF